MKWIPEAIGVVGFLTNVWANLLIARKSESGWIVRLVSNVLWLVFGVAQASLANTLNAVTFAGINVYGLRRWRRERLMRKTTCEDHHRILCRWCRQIVRQCRCCPGSDKLTTLDGVCGGCVAQLPPVKGCSPEVDQATRNVDPLAQREYLPSRHETMSEDECFAYIASLERCAGLSTADMIARARRPRYCHRILSMRCGWYWSVGA